MLSRPIGVVLCRLVLCTVLSGTGLVACAGSTAAVEALPTRPRPAGVAFDPPTHVPDHNVQGGVTALEQPALRSRLIEALDRFFSAVAREDIAALSVQFTPDAEAIVARGSKARAIEYWTRRLERLDYTAQFSSLIYSPATVEILESRGLDQTSAKTQALLLRPGELLARVPIAPALGNSKLFGKLIEVVLSDAAGGYKIRVVREDFELPEAPR